MTFGPSGLPLAFTIDGRAYELPDVGTRYLMDCLAAGDWIGLVPEAVAQPGRDELWYRLIDGRDPADFVAMQRIVCALAEEILGVTWHKAQRLAAAAAEHWLIFDGWCVEHGFDPLTSEPRRVLAAIQAWLRSTCTEDRQWRQIQGQLEDPVPPVLRPWETPDDVEAPGWSAEEEADMWFSAAETMASGP
ncbi:hypothetical protein [Streptomyces sp. TR02-1]|uniref:hypothetical protein n=1 Tax=Streptomyces sp. TR02-1 TaxID=3385977 RepID=UPI00399F8F21